VWPDYRCQNSDGWCKNDESYRCFFYSPQSHQNKRHGPEEVELFLDAERPTVSGPPIIGLNVVADKRCGLQQGCPAQIDPPETPENQETGKEGMEGGQNSKASAKIKCAKADASSASLLSY